MRKKDLVAGRIVWLEDLFPREYVVEEYISRGSYRKFVIVSSLRHGNRHFVPAVQACETRDEAYDLYLKRKAEELADLRKKVACFLGESVWVVSNGEVLSGKVVKLSLTEKEDFYTVSCRFGAWSVDRSEEELFCREGDARDHLKETGGFGGI